ncbi:hypothetical protein LK533_06710 [Sphingomonas sp. PL-96]|uniref:hypothetical protein n=1 Tax=Sphingomonas sp. PL-96 TaxID=2887201 RepID=UPI001E425F50|nr:hypothetical protein [Sphingomonas sp. PL-96]MCC2976363.1 hypothetical protein [Sphingomonas sp. PL-96]
MMVDARAFLIAALRRVADGGDIDNAELDAAVPDPLSLARCEKDAWEALSHWADDDDIRARDPRYATLMRDTVRRCLANLTQSDSGPPSHPGHQPMLKR